MQHFIRKFLTFVAITFVTLAAFAGNGTPQSPYTAQEAFENRDALAKTQEDVFIKVNFIGFGNSLKEATPQHRVGDNFIVGTAEYPIIVRAEQFVRGLEWADSKTDWLIHGYFIYEGGKRYDERGEYVFVAETLDGAYRAVIGDQGIGGFATKGTFMLRNSDIKLVSPYIYPQERKLLTETFPAHTTIAGSKFDYSAFLLVGEPGTYPVTLINQKSNLPYHKTMLRSGVTRTPDMNHTFYRFVVEVGRVGFELGENNGQYIDFNRPTEIYLALDYHKIQILKEALQLEDTHFLSLTPKTLTALRTISSLSTTTPSDVFDLNGRKVGRVAQLSSLPQGIYVINGKKILNH
jgi:hypothetical protein